MTETWAQIKARHLSEKRQLVIELANQRMTQAEATGILGMKRTALNNFIRRNDIYWPVKRQGRKSKC